MILYCIKKIRSENLSLEKITTGDGYEGNSPSRREWGRKSGQGRGPYSSPHPVVKPNQELN